MARGKKKKNSSSSSPEKKKAREESQEDEEVFEEFKELKELEELEENITGENVDTLKAIQQQTKVALNTNKKVNIMFEMLKEIREMQQKQHSDFLKLEKQCKTQQDRFTRQEAEIAELKKKMTTLEVHEHKNFEPEVTAKKRAL